MKHEEFNMPTERGGTISIIIPRPLTPKDMSRFRKWIDLIEDAITDTDPKLSDPTDLKVGDWVSKHGGGPERVTSVDVDGYFKTSVSTVEWSRDGGHFTVVPAPEGSEG